MAYNNRNGHHPFGPMMAQDIFIYNSDDPCTEDVYYAKDSDYGIKEAPLYPVIDGKIESYHYSVQDELCLESKEELIQRLQYQINRMEKSYNKMCHHALKWYYLMNDVSKNPQIEKMFKDMQVVRRLSGSENV